MSHRIVPPSVLLNTALLNDISPLLVTLQPTFNCVFYPYISPMIVQHWWNDIDREKRQYSEEKYVQVPLCSPQI